MVPVISVELVPIEPGGDSAEAAKVGLVDAQNGAVEVYAMTHDVFGLLRFAEKVRGMAKESDAIKAKIEPA